MTYRHVALIGRAGSGKDATGARLVLAHKFVRVAMADPLKFAALDLDPIVCRDAHTSEPVRLAAVVHRYGWDGAKAFPEVRRTLQRLGHGMRERDPDVWLRLALAKIDVADQWSVPVVVTDCRYRNEADALRGRGCLLVRIERPGHHGPASPDEREHVSETELDDYPVDAVLTNAGSLAELHQAADTLAVPR